MKIKFTPLGLNLEKSFRSGCLPHKRNTCGEIRVCVDLSVNRFCFYIMNKFVYSSY